LFLIFCPKVATTISTKQEYCPIDGYIKEDSFMEKLPPKKYGPCALILVFKIHCISESYFRVIDKRSFLYPYL